MEEGKVSKKGSLPLHLQRMISNTRSATTLANLSRSKEADEELELDGRFGPERNGVVHVW